MDDPDFKAIEKIRIFAPKPDQFLHTFEGGISFNESTNCSLNAK